MTTRVRVRAGDVRWSPSWRTGRTTRPTAGMLASTAYVLSLPVWLVLRGLWALAALGVRVGMRAWQRRP